MRGSSMAAVAPASQSDLGASLESRMVGLPVTTGRNIDELVRKGLIFDLGGGDFDVVSPFFMDHCASYGWVGSILQFRCLPAELCLMKGITRTLKVIKSSKMVEPERCNAALVDLKAIERGETTAYEELLYSDDDMDHEQAYRDRETELEVVKAVKKRKNELLTRIHLSSVQSFRDVTHKILSDMRRCMTIRLRNYLDRLPEWRDAGLAHDLLGLWGILERCVREPRIPNVDKVNFARDKLYELHIGKDQDILDYNVVFDSTVRNGVYLGYTCDDQQLINTYLRSLLTSEKYADKARRLMEPDVMKASGLTCYEEYADLMVEHADAMGAFRTHSSVAQVPTKPVVIERRGRSDNIDRSRVFKALRRDLKKTKAQLSKLRASTDARRPPGSKSGTAKDICYAFQRTGTCSRGDSCRFKHTRGNATVEAPSLDAAKSRSARVVSYGDEDDILGRDLFATSKCKMAKRRFDSLSYESAGRCDVMLDGGANVCVVKDIRLCDEVFDLKEPKLIDGIGGDMIVTKGCRLKYPFSHLQAYYDEDAADNILADCEVCNVFSKFYDGKQDTYTFVHKRDGFSVQFARARDGLYYYKVYTAAKVMRVRDAVLNSISKERIKRAERVEDLHRKLSFVGLERLRDMVRHNLICGCDLTGGDVTLYMEKFHKTTCLGCAVGKTTQAPAVSSTSEPADAVGARTHWDLFYVTADAMDTLQAVLCVDEATGYKSVVFVKSRTKESIMKAITTIINEYTKRGHRCKAARFDRESALVALKPVLAAMGIVCEYCQADRHVRRAETAIRRIKDAFRATIFGLQYRLPSVLYADCIEYCVQSLNLTHTDELPLMTVWEAFTGQKVSEMDQLKMCFGDIVIMYNNDHNKKTLEPRGEIGLIVGRDTNQKGAAYILKLGQDKTVVSRAYYSPFELTRDVKDIIQSLDTVQHTNMVWLDGDKVAFDDDNVPVTDDTPRPKSIHLEGDDALYPEVTELSDVDQGGNLSALDDRTEPYTQESVIAEENDGAGEEVAQATDGQEPETTANNVRRSSRPRKVKVYSAIVGRVASNLTMSQALKLYGPTADDSVWAELQQLIGKGVWSYIPVKEVQQRLANGEQAIPSSIFLKAKHDAFGKFEKLKARLVACGNWQVSEGLELVDSPTVCVMTVLTVISMTAKKQCLRRVYDVVGAYLHATIGKHQLMKINRPLTDIMVSKDPKLRNYVNNDGCLIVQLEKCLYGLREAAKAWYVLISKRLVEKGYSRSEWDTCLFYKTTSDNAYIIAVLYVDDMLVCAETSEAMNIFDSDLRSCFPEVTVKDGKELSFLGMVIMERDNGDVIVCQDEYIRTVLDDYPMVIGEPLSTPANEDLVRVDEGVQAEPCDRELFIRTVMQLMYVAIRTRPDILYAVTVLATRTSKATLGDMHKLMRVLRYLKGTLRDGLLFAKDGDLDPNMFVDASFAAHPDCKGHTGYVIFMDRLSSGILYKSAKQKSVTESSTEAELVALHEAVRMFTYAVNIMVELGFHRNFPLEVYQDNQACILLSQSEMVNFRGKSKYILRKYFSVHERVKNDEIGLVYVGTEDQLADFFTKAIMGTKFDRLRLQLMYVSPGRA